MITSNDRNMNVTATRSIVPEKPSKGGFYYVTKLLSISIIAILASIIISLIISSWPAIKQFGLQFIWNNNWNPVTHQFGALSTISGTLITSAIALVIGIPFSIAIALTITHILSGKARKTMRLLIDLMAGIPSIIYGMWGLFVFAPMLQTSIGPWIIDTLGHLPLIGYLFQGPSLGIGLLTAGMILALMIIPTMTSMMSDIIETTPNTLIEAGNSLGVTRYSVISNIVIPFVRTGLVGSCMLGLGRALGETMAVTFVIGNSHFITSNLFMPGSTIASTIANEFNEATGTLYPASLMELALILFSITFIVILASRFLLTRYKR